MVGLRLADPLIQFTLLRDGHAANLMQSLLRMPQSYALAPAVLAVPGISRFSIGGLNEVASAVVAMYGIAALRHAYWALFTRQYDFPLSGGIFVGVYNGIMNALTTGLLVYCTSQAPFTSQTLGWKQYLGIALFAAGIGLEVVPEETRKSFKSKPENKGKLDDTGAWGVVRHVNYLGYTLWRTGVMLATGSVGAAVAQAAFHAYFFISTSIPDIDSQMTKKYGPQWEGYKRKVPYAFIPGVY